jgi:PAS domain S-box-containing protein
MDGYRLCFELRKDEKLRALPFIIYTSTYTSAGDQKLALDMGVDRYLTKPASAQTILASLHALKTRTVPPPAPSIDAQSEAVLIKEYSQQLVAKLEERNLELVQLTSDLHATNAKLQHLLTHSPAVIYGLRLVEGNVVPHVVSDNITELLGFEVDETLQFEWWTGQLHPQDRDRAAASLFETMNDGTSRTEYRIRHKDGTYRWVEDNRRLIRDEAGHPQEFVGVWADITARKKLEAEIAMGDRRMNAFFSNATAGLCIFDPEMRYLQINETLATMNGRSVAGHAGRTIREVLPDLAATIEPILARVLSTNQPELNVEITGRTAAQPQMERHWMASYFPLSSTGDVTTGIGSVVVEVTERKAAEVALRASEVRFRQLTEHIQEVFWMTTPDFSEVLYVSPAFETIWGLSMEHLYANPHAWIEAILAEDRDHVLAAFAGVTNGAPKISVEYRIRHSDGKIRWLQDRGFPILDEAGKLYRIAGIAKDISEQKHLEESLRRAQKMEAIGQLAGGIAHDFNNILGCILGYAELAVQDAGGNVAVQSDLQEIQKASLRAKDLVRQILTFSRQQEQERRPILLRTVILEALTLLRASLPATIEIESKLADDGLLVMADASQIHQVILNLATNAAHAMRGRGRLKVELGPMHVDEDLAALHTDLHVGPYVRMAVVDSGCGMDHETLQHIFEPFFTTKAPGEGTGLGLAVVDGIVRGHEAAITVYSEVGQGTAFHLYFPVHGARDVPASQPVVQRTSGAGEHVLLVDDEPALAALCSRILERAGYRVTVRTNAREALELFRSDPADFDLVITDFTMPDLNGVDLAAEIQRVRPGLRIILVTGFGGSMTPRNTRDLGFCDMLMKPVTGDTLLSAVHHAMLQAKAD